MNWHIGEIVNDNHSKTTVAGKLMKEFIENGEYVLVNAMENKVVNGPFTWYDKTDPNEDKKKSLQDKLQ